MSEFGKFNTYLFLAHQYIEQIDDGMVKAMLSNTENKVVGRNSAATKGSICSKVGVSKEDLMTLKKYQFYVKSGDRRPFLFQSADFLLDKPNSKFYITEEEAKEEVDKEMIEKYYNPVGVSDGTFTHSNLPIAENGQKATQTSHTLNVQLDNNDF